VSHYLAGSDGVKKLVSGGDPMFLNSPITLCGRVDLNADRFFDGRLAELSIFDNALTRPQVAFLSVENNIVCLLNTACHAMWPDMSSPGNTPIVARLGGNGSVTMCRWRTSTPRVLLGCKMFLCRVSCHAQGLNISLLFQQTCTNVIGVLSCSWRWRVLRKWPASVQPEASGTGTGCNMRHCRRHMHSTCS
jgi:hypothetical protein